MPQHRAPRSFPWGWLAILCVIVAAVVWVIKPAPPQVPKTAPLPSQAIPEVPDDEDLRPKYRPTPSADTPPPRTCQPGTPKQFIWADMGIKTTFEQVGVNTELPPDKDGHYPLGDPEDKRKMGWYKYGPKPGSGKGNVIIDGHTYRNGTAVFKEDFSSVLKKGSKFTIITAEGSACTYQVTRVFPAINKLKEYSRAVDKYNFYATEGPEQVFGVTCSGSFNSVRGTHEDVTAWIAKPIN